MDTWRWSEAKLCVLGNTLSDEFARPDRITTAKTVATTTTTHLFSYHSPDRRSRLLPVLLSDFTGLVSIAFYTVRIHTYIGPTRALLGQTTISHSKFYLILPVTSACHTKLRRYNPSYNYTFRLPYLNNNSIVKFSTQNLPQN